MRPHAIARLAAATLLAFALTTSASASSPGTSYIFPAGAQRGTTVRVIVGGHYLYEACAWDMLGTGVTVSNQITRPSGRSGSKGPASRCPPPRPAKPTPRTSSAPSPSHPTRHSDIATTRRGLQKESPPDDVSSSGTCPRWSRRKSTGGRSPPPSRCPSRSMDASSPAKTSTSGPSPQQRAAATSARSTPRGSGRRWIRESKSWAPTG